MHCGVGNPLKALQCRTQLPFRAMREGSPPDNSSIGSSSAFPEWRMCPACGPDDGENAEFQAGGGLTINIPAWHKLICPGQLAPCSFSGAQTDLMINVGALSSPTSSSSNIAYLTIRHPQSKLRTLHPQCYAAGPPTARMTVKAAPKGHR